jgi:exodeoxyribonuclease VII large subunit
MDALSVTGITAYLKTLIEHDEVLSDVWIKGEISNFKRASSGYIYFTLKDNDAQLRCAIFKKGLATNTLKDGVSVQAHGKISVYEARGDYQLYVDDIQMLKTIGDLYQQFEELKSKLASEGLFDEAYKQELPAFPKRIGIVSSAEAAGFKDVLSVLDRRYPIAEVVLSPTLVQGADAPPQIVRAIQQLSQRDDIDVILICRGGGSIEDLWAFNNETVARAIFASPIPIITGIGHEIDFTIADFVADLRAPTPSAAAEMMTPSKEKLLLDVQVLQQNLQQAVLGKFQGERERLARQQKTLQLLSPTRTLTTYQQKVDDLNERLILETKRSLSYRRERVQALTQRLEALSPQGLLARGYALVTRSDNQKHVSKKGDAPVGTAIKIQLKDGTLSARIEDDKINEQYKRTLF